MELELTSADSQEANENNAAWTPHMIGLGRSQPSSDRRLDEETLPLAAIKARCRKPLSRRGILLEDLGEPRWHRIGVPLDRLNLAGRWRSAMPRRLPERDDRCFALSAPSRPDRSRLPGAALLRDHRDRRGHGQTGATFVPFSVDTFMLFDVPSTHHESWCHARLRDHSPDDVVADLSILNSAGQLVAKLAGFRLRPITRDAVAAPRDQTTLGAGERRVQTGPRRIVEPLTAISSVQSMMRYLQTQCAELSGFPESTITAESGFMALGLDSMVAMVLSNQIRLDFDCAISATQILGSKSIESLAHEIWQAMSH